MRDTLVLKVNIGFDHEYGRWDFAPRIMGTNGNEWEGRVGWLLAFDPKEKLYLVNWEDHNELSWIKLDDFEILTGIMF